MKYRFFILALAIPASLFLFFGGPTVLWAADANISELPAYTGDITSYSSGLDKKQEEYDAVLDREPDNYDALWRLSQLYVARGMLEKSKKNKKKQWRKAEHYARRAIESNSEGACGHLYVAISVGKISRISSAGEKVENAKEIKKETQKAIELDPSYHKPYLTLGTWHRNIADASSLEKQLAKIFFGAMPEGTLEDSLELLLKSIELGGASVRNYYELGLTYEAMKDYEAAKREYKKALSAPLFFPEDAEIKEKIKKTLRKSRYK